MNKLMVVAIILVATSAAWAQRSELQMPAGEVPLQVRDSEARLNGHFDSNQMLRLAFGLQPPHLAEEEQFLRELQDPKSPQFRRFLTAEQWNARYSPSAVDEQAVLEWAKSEGLTITHRYPNRLLVDVEAPVATIEKALQVTINRYEVEGDSLFSNDRAPVIPSSLSGIIHSVEGLNNIERIHPASFRGKRPVPSVYTPGPVVALGGSLHGNGDQSKLPKPWMKGGAAPPITNGYYDPADIYSSQAYDYQALHNLGHCCNPLGNAGGSPPAGSIALATFGTVANSDLNGFFSQYPYLSYNIQFILIDGGPPPAPEDEATLDTEWSTATSNSLDNYLDTAEVFVYQGGDASDMYNQMLTDGYASTFSTSYGCTELICATSTIMDTRHLIFNEMVGLGWTLMAAAGDGGSTDDCQTVSVDYPASDPDVIAVGGTYLGLNSNGTFNQEVAWTGNTAPGSCSKNQGGTGGGCSAYFSYPSYQGSALGCGDSFSNRSVPDIALNAAHGQNYYFNGSLQGVGGTSIAAPMLAGFFAQESAYLLYLDNLTGSNCGPNHVACSPLGNANHALYYEGLHSNFAAHYPFYDITSGCNTNDITAQLGLTYFCANPGFDQTTGWGTANMLQLAWAINTFIAGDFVAPSVFWTAPPSGVWYNTNQTISWTIDDIAESGVAPNGVAGFSQAWDADPGDIKTEPTPGAGNSFYSGPQHPNGTSGSIALSSSTGQGCHTVHVRPWDNAGTSSDWTLGPFCFDSVPPVTTATASGTIVASGGLFAEYLAPVQITLTAVDSSSGVAGTVYSLDSGPQQTYTVPFTVSALGLHIVTFHSTDVAGNVESTEQAYFVIVNTVSSSTSTSGFPATPVNASSAPQNVVLSINSSMRILSITVPPSQGSKQEWALGAVTGCIVDGSTVNPAGTTCTVPVTFQPAYAGLRSGSLAMQTSVGTFHFGLNGIGQGPELTELPGVINTVAGNGTAGYTGDNNYAVLAELNSASRMTLDPAGNLYLADSSNHVIREVVAATGNIYTIAGTGVAGFSGDGFAAFNAKLNNPSGVAFDAAGNLYIADQNNQRIRMISANTGAISTVAGNGTQGYSADGIAAVNSRLAAPAAVAVDAAGNLYISDNLNQRIRRVDAATGFISTVAGEGNAGFSGDGGAATNAWLNYPGGIALDAAGNLYIADTFNSVIRRVDATSGVITTVAGDATFGYSGNGGAATAAALYEPEDVAVDAAGDVYIADAGNQVIREVAAATGVITTMVGNGLGANGGSGGFNGDGIPATSAELWFPRGVALDATGSLYISDTHNQRIRQVSTVTGTLNLGQNYVGTANNAASFLAANIGNQPLTFNGFSVSANFLGDSVDSNCSVYTPLAAGASCVESVLFAPTVAGALFGSFTMNDNNLNVPFATQSVGLTGYAVTPVANIFVNSNPNPSNYGQQVTFFISVLGPDGGPTPTGTVTLAGLPGGSKTFTLTGFPVQYTTSSLAPGTYSATAMYSGNLYYAPAASSVDVQTVNPAATSVALQSQPNPSTGGQLVAFAATVTPAAGPNPTGTVTFFNGAAAMGSANLSAGVATLRYSSLTAGVHSVTATYNGSTIAAGSSSAPLAQTVTLEPTVTTLTSSLNPSTWGQTVAFTATVTAGNGVTPAGTVGFYNGNTLLGNASLTGGSAALNYSKLPAGTNSVTARYTGSNYMAASTSTVVSQVVQGISTATALTSTPNPSNLGQTVTFAAQVTGSNGGIPAGTVTFFNGASSIGTGTLNGSGTVSLNYAGLPLGTASLTAAFNGSSTYAVSLSTALTQTVNPATTATVLAAAPNPSFGGQTVAFTATVTTSNGAIPTGTVTFRNGAASIGNATLAAQSGAGVAVLNYAGLPVGTDNIAATYNGSASQPGSTSNPVALVVNLATTTTTLASSVNPSTGGQIITFTATVSASGGGKPTGTVTFYNGATSIGSATLTATGGMATLNYASLVAGTHSITATYNGSATDASSTSTAVSQVVNLDTTTTSLATSPDPSTSGSSVVLTAAVTPGNGVAATGTVSFYSGSALLGNASLSSGVATLSHVFATTGTDSLTVKYTGSNYKSASTSSVVTQTVN